MLMGRTMPDFELSSSAPEPILSASENEQHHHGDSLKLTSSNLLHQEAYSKDSLDRRQAFSEFAGTLGSGILGTCAFSMLPERIKLPVRLAAAATVGGISRVEIKGGLELALLPEDKRTLSPQDFGWGAIDGLAGVAASAMEQAVSRKLTISLGRRFASETITAENALQVGEKVLAGSISERIKQNAIRGVAAGAAGSFVVSLPHAIMVNSGQLNNITGWENIGKEVGSSTLVGASFGGLLSTSLSTLVNAKDIFRYAQASLMGDIGTTRVNILHFNDLHSSLIGDRASLPQIASKATELRAAAAQRGEKAFLFDLGDNYSGNVIAGSTNVGHVETSAIQRMNVDGFIPGNHVADIGFGQTDVAAWVKNITSIQKELGREIPAIATNIEVPSAPGFIGAQGSYKPYRVIEAANGEKIGLIGLVTRELETGSDGAVKYLPSTEMADKTIRELNGNGVNKIVVLSHMGRSEDVALAKSLKGKVAAIVGAHSHDIEPVPVWVRNSANGNEIPIVQAGSKGGWLGELKLAIKPDGSADKFRSRGTLHEIGPDIKPDPEIKSYIETQTSAIASKTEGTYKITDLHNQVHNDINVLQAFSQDGIRGDHGVQTPLATLISRGLLEEVNSRLPQLNAERAAQGLNSISPLSIMLKHTGDIREEVPKGILNRLKASNVFLNTGSEARETRELAAIQLTGKQLRRALEFGVSDLAPAEATSANSSTFSQFRDKVKALFVEPQNLDLHDYSGNFLAGEGVRYSYNRTLPPAQRVTSVEVFDQASKTWTPADPEKTYDVLTLFHPVDKWGKVGMISTYNTEPVYHTAENWVFGQRLLSAEARAAVNAEPIKLSQVDLLLSYMKKQNALSPTKFMSDAVRDTTPKAWQAPILLGRYSLPSMAFSAAIEGLNVGVGYSTQKAQEKPLLN